MAFRISGFGGARDSGKPAAAHEPEQKTLVPRKSLVQVRFPGKGAAVTYYNDRFDLSPGDRVYVEGKQEGRLGRVVEISYSFKIKLSDYKKVIAVADTDVHGEFHMARSHFVTFDPHVLPAAQAILWFKAPPGEDEEIISSTDDSSFRLDDLSGMNISAAVAERGHDYYIENRVRYLCLRGGMGYAIVEGGENYGVEFEYQDGQISRLVCECPCSYTCKHEFAAMLQLKETLALIDKHYADEYAKTGCFTAISKSTLFGYAIEGKETGSFVL